MKVKTKFDPPWEHCMTMLEWAKYQWLAGHDEVANAMIRNLPESVRAKYRDCYVEIREQRKRAGKGGV